MSWQLTLTILCVAVAGWFLARRLQAFVRGAIVGGRGKAGHAPGDSFGCGSAGCGSCSTSDAASNLGQAKPFVSIDALDVSSPMLNLQAHSNKTGD